MTTSEYGTSGRVLNAVALCVMKVMKSFGLESEIDRSSKDKDSKTLPLYYYVENYILVGFPCRYSRGSVDDIRRLQISWYFKTRS